MPDDRSDQEERSTHEAGPPASSSVRPLPPPFQVQNASTQLQTFIERMPLGCLISDANFLYTHWNPAAERMFGWKQEEILGKHPFDVIVPLAAQPYVAGIFERLRQGEPQISGVNPNHTQAGGTIYCQWTSTPLLDLESKFAGILSMAQDVSERVQMQESLKASEQRYRTIVETAQEGIWMVDPTGLTLFANRRLAELLGWTVEEMRGRPFVSLLYEADQLAGQIYLEDSRKNPVRQLDLRLRRRDGQTIWALVAASPLRNDRDQLVGSLLMLTDITERRYLEAQFLESQKLEAVGRLAAGVAHDFNTLLTVITGYSELLLRGLASPPPPGEEASPPPTLHAGTQEAADRFRELVREIHQASVRATSLTRQLLVFSHKSVPEPGAGDVNPGRSEAPSAPDAVRPGSETILLVEDESGPRSVGRLVLQAWGYKVLESNNGEEALAVVEKHTGPIHLLIADMVLPQMSGPKLAEQAQRLRPDLKVLFLSGAADADPEPPAAFLRKPFTPTLLAAKVRMVLEGKD